MNQTTPSAAGGSSSRDFRSTLGRFATGVTVVTALTPDEQPIGVTISSFNSVSLDPRLILWSLSVESPKLEAFREASHFAVNVLATDQRNISNRFASRDRDRFADLPVLPGLGITGLDIASRSGRRPQMPPALAVRSTSGYAVLQDSPICRPFSMSLRRERSLIQRS